MIRCRFFVSDPDPRPVRWPIKHPYWITGRDSSGDHVLVAYADDLQELLSNWPDATNVDFDHCEEYTFTDRFQKPSWFED